MYRHFLKGHARKYQWVTLQSSTEGRAYAVRFKVFLITFLYFLIYFLLKYHFFIKGKPSFL